MEFAVITGCLRISKESIFTGLNNLTINSIRSSGYGEYFGFTDEEVYTMLSYYGLSDKYEEVRDWYNGYIFGGKNALNMSLKHPEMKAVFIWHFTLSEKWERSF